MQNYWQYTDLNVLSGINDGFELSIIEIYANGVPSITFANLDAVDDEYSAQGIIKIPNRKDDVIVNKINQALDKKNSQKIENFGRNFSIEFMVAKNLESYKRIMKTK